MKRGHIAALAACAAVATWAWSPPGVDRLERDLAAVQAAQKTLSAERVRRANAARLRDDDRLLDPAMRALLRESDELYAEMDAVEARALADREAALRAALARRH